jgi:hypothetical protein
MDIAHPGQCGAWLIPDMVLHRAIRTKADLRNGQVRGLKSTRSFHHHRTVPVKKGSVG